MKNTIFSAFLCLAMIVPPTTRAASSGVAEFVSSTTNQGVFVAAPAEATVYQLLAGQRIEAGTSLSSPRMGASSWSPTAPPALKIRETHLELALRVQDFPPHQEWESQPRSFRLWRPQAPGTTAVQYVFNLCPDVPAGTALSWALTPWSPATEKKPPGRLASPVRQQLVHLQHLHPAGPRPRTRRGQGV